jgi:hypothetical protein
MKLVIETDQVYFYFNQVFRFKFKKKICFRSKDLFQSHKSGNCYHPEDFSSTNGLHPLSNYCECGSSRYKGINGEFAGNTSSGTRNPPEKWLFRRKLPAP